MSDAIHDPAAVIPRPGDRVRVAHVGSVQTIDGRTINVSVIGPDVVIRGEGALNQQQQETFAALFVRAVWLTAKEE